MKKDKFDTAINGINEDLIAEAANIVPKRKRLNITRYASAVAACAVFAVGAALVKNHAMTVPELSKHEEHSGSIVESQDINSYSDQFTSETDNEKNVLKNVSDFQPITENVNYYGKETAEAQQFNEDKATSVDLTVNENDNGCNSDTVIREEPTSNVEISDTATDVNANTSVADVPDETATNVVNIEPTVNTNDNGNAPDTPVYDNGVCDKLWSITLNGKTYVENRTSVSGFTPNQYLGTIAEFDEASGPYDTYNTANEVYTTNESETVLLIKLSDGKTVALSLLQ